MLLMFSLTVLASCQDVLEEEFQNPQQYVPNPDQLASGMFTNALLQYKFYIKDYGEYWWQLSGNGILIMMMLQMVMVLIKVDLIGLMIFTLECVIGD